MSLPGSAVRAPAQMMVALWEMSGSYRPVLWLGIAVCAPVLTGLLVAALTRPRGLHSSPGRRRDGPGAELLHTAVRPKRVG